MTQLLQLPTREEWLAERRNSLGASDIAQLMVKGRWWQVWIDKHPDPEKRFGADNVAEARRIVTPRLSPLRTMAEGYAAGLLEERLGRKTKAAENDLVRAVGGRVHMSPDVWVSNPDPNPIKSSSGVPDHVQVKTAGEWSKAWTDGPDPYAVVQCHAEMLVLEAEMEYLAKLHGFGDRGDADLELSEVVRNPNLIEKIEEEVDRFWRLIESDTPPPMTGLEADLKLLRALLPAQKNAVQVFVGEQAWDQSRLVIEGEKELKDLEAKISKAKQELERLAADGGGEQLVIESEQGTALWQRSSSDVKASTCKNCGEVTRAAHTRHSFKLKDEELYD